MKTRIGFVSNSSSSSFVAIGAIVPRNKISKLEFCKQLSLVPWDCTEEDFDEKIEERDPITGRDYYDILNEYWTDNEEDGAPKGKTIIGYIRKIGEEGPYLNLDLEDKIEKIKSILDVIGLSDEPIKLITGVMVT